MQLLLLLFSIIMEVLVIKINVGGEWEYLDIRKNDSMVI